eukprot:5015607-Pyramimonas_sp.AAC.1
MLFSTLAVYGCKRTTAGLRPGPVDRRAGRVRAPSRSAPRTFARVSVWTRMRARAGAPMPAAARRRLRGRPFKGQFI